MRRATKLFRLMSLEYSLVKLIKQGVILVRSARLMAKQLVRPLATIESVQPVTLFLN